ncbi:MAG TPA: aldo/keto reductase [Actinomycetota bacterium]|jgi:aryl-alcohol dehydrogenase-like predicted oxidoreductase
MRYRQLGRSGLTVSVVGLGGNNFGLVCDAAQTRAVVWAALDAGITLFDTADVYGHRGGSETLLGQALGRHRDEVVVATKFGMDMGGPPQEARASRRHIRRAVEGSLRRLGFDYLDLYQQHAPDRRTPLEETLAALDELVGEGKVRYVGSCNFAAWQIVEADWIARSQHRTPFVSAQNHYSLLERDLEQEVIPACQRYGIGVLPYYPLANGLLTGKYKRGEPPPPRSRLAERGITPTEETFDRLEGLEKYAVQRGLTLLEVAVGGLAAQPGVTSVVAGATRPDQVRANVTAALWEPTQEDLEELAALAPRRPQGKQI